MGRELFPVLILAVALAMAAEQLLANRFYQTAEAGPAKPAVGDVAGGVAHGWSSLGARTTRSLRKQRPTCLRTVDFRHDRAAIATCCD